MTQVLCQFSTCGSCRNSKNMALQGADGVREMLRLQQEIDGVASQMSSLMTNDSSQFVLTKCPVYFASEDSNNTEIEKFVQMLKQELLAGSNASAKSLRYLQTVSATTLAAVYRGHLGRQAYGVQYAVRQQERRLAATIKIQKWYGMVVGMKLARIRRLEIEMEWKSAAATQIQRMFKGHHQTKAVQSVIKGVRQADFQFHLTRGAAFDALSKPPAKASAQRSSNAHGDSDASTSTSEDDDDHVTVGAKGWLPPGVRRNIHDETFREGP